MMEISTFEQSCFTLYHSYRILNHVCWHGKLPVSRLSLSYRRSFRRMAFAQSLGANRSRIVFNAGYCRRMDDAHFLEVMAHEMIHVYQFSQGRTGGHGRDFQAEQRRMGLILGMPISPSSPFGYVLFMHTLKQLHPAEAVRSLAASRPSQKQYLDFFIEHLTEFDP